MSETICPKCRHKGLSLDAYTDLQAAAMLIPCSYAALAKHLSRHKREFPPLYRRIGPGGRRLYRVRVLSGREVRSIREQMFWGPGKEKKVVRALIASWREPKR